MSKKAIVGLMLFGGVMGFFGATVGRNYSGGAKVVNITNMDYEKVTVTVEGRQRWLSDVLVDFKEIARREQMAWKDARLWWSRLRHVCPEMLPAMATAQTYNYEPLKNEGDRLRYNRCLEAFKKIERGR